MTNNLQQMQHVGGLYAANDVKSCYDRVVHSIAIPLLRGRQSRNDAQASARCFALDLNQVILTSFVTR